MREEIQSRPEMANNHTRSIFDRKNRILRDISRPINISSHPFRVIILLSTVRLPRSRYANKSKVY